MSIRETFQSFSIGPCTSSTASRNDQLGARIFWFFSKSNWGRLPCMSMTWPGLTIETPSGVPLPPWFYTRPFITLLQHLHFNMILFSTFLVQIWFKTRLLGKYFELNRETQICLLTMWGKCILISMKKAQLCWWLLEGKRVSTQVKRIIFKYLFVPCRACSAQYCTGELEMY